MDADDAGVCPSTGTLWCICKHAEMADDGVQLVAARERC